MNALEIIYTQYGLRKVASKAQKIKQDGGMMLTHWAGSITFDTTRAIINEDDVTRDFDVLITAGHIPVFGMSPMLSGVSFKWGIRPVANGNDPDNPTMQEYVTVTISYLSYIKNLDVNERKKRLEALGYSYAQ